MAVLESAVHAGLTHLPLNAFCAGGGFAEELVAILPSPLVMGSAGSAAFHQHKTILFLAWLTALGAFGKTLGAFLLYLLSHKFELAAMSRFGSVLGVSHSQIEKIGKFFTRSWKDFFAILILRMLPVVPSTVLSFACGILKTDLRDFLTATFTGPVLRNFLYLYLGYEGNAFFESAARRTESGIFYFEIAVGLIFLGGVWAWIYNKKIRKKFNFPENL